jgi:hypothetical protein
MVGAYFRGIPAAWSNLVSAFKLISRLDYAYLQLSERETTTSAHTTVVFDCWASDNGSELVDGTRSDLDSLLNTGRATCRLATGLVGFVNTSSS